MKIFLLFISLIVLSPKENRTCKSIKTGKFTNKKRDTQITRTNDYQTEICKEEGLSWKWKLYWKDDCEYDMVLEDDLSTNPTKVFELGDTINIKILGVETDKYDWEATYKGRSFKNFNYILK